MTRYKVQANQVQEQYIDLYTNAGSEKAIDLINVAELSYAKQVAMIAAVIYNQTEDKQLGMSRAKSWIEDCIRDVTQNIRVAAELGFDRLGYPNPYLSDTNAKVVADILEKIREQSD